MGITYNYSPNYRLIANDVNVTDKIADRLVSLRYTDAVGMESDMLEIVLADHKRAAPLAIPPKGSELQLFMGYGTDMRRVGLFVSDEIEVGFPCGQLVIRARAATYKASKSGKADLQSQKSRSWEEGTTLATLVKTIAKEHGLTPVIAAALGAVALPHVDQTDESDLNLLLRLTRRYDAFVKPAGGKLVISKRGASTTASGVALPSAQIYEDDVAPDSGRLVESSRETAGTVVAYYHAIDDARRAAVKVGSGKPERRLKTSYPSEAMALAAARADLARRKRGMRTLSFQTVGSLDVVAEGTVDMVDFREGVAGKWLVKRVDHTLDVGGWSMRVECEELNSGTVEDASVEYTDPETVSAAA